MLGMRGYVMDVMGWERIAADEREWEGAEWGCRGTNINVMWRVVARCGALRCVAACCGVSRCVAACCGVMWCAVVCCGMMRRGVA